MERLRAAHAILADVDQRLRELIRSAAEAGSYDEVHAIAALAERVSAAGAGAVQAPEADRFQPSRHRGTGSEEVVASSSMPATRQDRDPSPGSSEYPRFVREGDFLVKVGWSVSQGSTYEHKAPRDAVDKLVKRIGELGDGGQRFTADALSTHTGDNGNRDIPGYQLYLCLAWMKRAGLVKQHGRRWYSLRDPAQFSTDVERHWAATPVR